jgi:hypothetical protein
MPVVGGHLHTICALAIDDWKVPDIADALGDEPAHIHRALRSPKGQELMAEMQAMRMEAIVDPIRQQLQEYADDAVQTLAELLKADSESVREQAAKDILHMGGYRPHSGSTSTAEKVPQITVNNNNIVVGDNAPPPQAVTADYSVEQGESHEQESNGQITAHVE